MEDLETKLGTLARATILAQDEINDLKKKIGLIETRSVTKTDMERELSALETEQSRRLSEIDEFRQNQKTSYSPRRPCFV